ncbi:hypothetical protein NVP1076O_31 [Vibrio phage 1.076.O._10N.286.51.B7]|nr:hypothetical protein NVP1076O_31 [Vibrio phage 1.076.O._10N.286.51.B7]
MPYPRSGRGDVETVSGAPVDNTDPKNPVIRSAKFDRTFEYMNNAPVTNADQDTGIIAANLPAETTVIITVLFTVTSTGEAYAIPIQTDNTLALLQPDVRQLRSAEPVTGVGDVAFASWVDGTAGTYHYSLDVDGGGKVLNSVSLIARSLV